MMNNDIFNYIMSRLIDNAHDVVEDVKKNPDSDYEKGRQLAYYEVLDTIRNVLDVYEYDLKECGLEEDPMKMLYAKTEA